MIMVDLERANSRVATVEQRNVSLVHPSLVYHPLGHSHSTTPIIPFILLFHLAILSSILRAFN